MDKSAGYVAKGLMEFRPSAIALWGSHGMGLNDKYTHDVDVLVFVDSLPKGQAKHKILSKLSDKSVKLPFNGDFVLVDGKIYEILFKTCREAEKAVAKMKDGDISMENFVAVYIKNTKALYDSGWLRRQLNTVSKYPEKLLESVIRYNLYMGLKQYDYFKRELKRKKPICAEYMINEGIGNLVKLVYALNRCYYGKSKWIEAEMGNFSTKPAGFQRSILKVIKTRDIEMYRKLSMRVFSLCKKKYPKLSEEMYKTYENSLKYDEQVEKKNRIKP
jgi:hypothetical protein